MWVREKAADFIAQRVEKYVAANSSALVNKLLKLDPKNWRYMAVAPALNGVAIEGA